jgi:hypothetical protein
MTFIFKDDAAIWEQFISHMYTNSCSRKNRRWQSCRRGLLFTTTRRQAAAHLLSIRLDIHVCFTSWPFRWMQMHCIFPAVSSENLIECMLLAEAERRNQEAQHEEAWIDKYYELASIIFICYFLLSE